MTPKRWPLSSQTSPSSTADPARFDSTRAAPRAALPGAVHDWPKPTQLDGCVTEPESADGFTVARWVYAESSDADLIASVTLNDLEVAFCGASDKVAVACPAQAADLGAWCADRNTVATCKQPICVAQANSPCQTVSNIAVCEDGFSCTAHTCDAVEDCGEEKNDALCAPDSACQISTCAPNDAPEAR